MKKKFKDVLLIVMILSYFNVLIMACSSPATHSDMVVWILYAAISIILATVLTLVFAYISQEDYSIEEPAEDEPTYCEQIMPSKEFQFKYLAMKYGNENEQK